MEENVTHNITVPNNDLEILRNYFPQCFDKNGSFDFEKFKTQLKSNEVDFSKESYGIDWLGKSYARLLACDAAITLLKENKTWNSKEENKNAEHILIKGDNLEVLKHLANAYHQKIKMIYIDPPYNTGSDNFIYEDDRKYTVQQIKQLAGVDEEKARKIYGFINNKNNSHSAWLTFMYPRLYIAKQLLKEDGIIFISIDDNEVAQLKLLMDEIFGEENFVAELPTIMNLKGNNDEIGFAGTHEYTIVYTKQKDIIKFNQFIIEEDALDEWQEDEIGFYKQGANLKRTGQNAPREDRPNLFFPIFIDSNDNVYVTDDNEPPKQFSGELTKLFPITNKQEMTWRWSKNKIKKDIHDIIISRNGNIGIYKKQRPGLGELPSKKPKTLFYKPEYSSGNGTAQIKELFNNRIFQNPKPINLIKDFITIGLNSNDIILDFFAGSGTTADAVLQLNAEDLGNRKFILVQLPEPIDEKKNKTAYDFVKQLYENETNYKPTIFDITKERIIRATKKIKEENIDSLILEKTKDLKNLEGELNIENKEENIKKIKSEIDKLKNQDLGFKIFETIPIWKNYDLEATKFKPEQQLFDENKLSEEDIETILTTWKTKDNIFLTENLKTIDLDCYTGYYASNKLYLMHKGFETKNLIKILEQIDSNKNFQPSSIIVFGYNFESKNLREISENIVAYRNKKSIEIDFIIRY